MPRRIIPRERAARELAVSTKVLARYESLGLVQVAHEGAEEGYEPAQIRRLWSIVTYQRDLGINLAGVEVILHLVDHLAQVHHRVFRPHRRAAQRTRQRRLGFFIRSPCLTREHRLQPTPQPRAANRPGAGSAGSSTSSPTPARASEKPSLRCLGPDWWLWPRSADC